MRGVRFERSRIALIAGLLFALGTALGACGDAPPPADPAPEPKPVRVEQPPLPPTAPTAGLDPDEIIHEFRLLWHGQREVFKNRFLGVPTQQNPFDAWIFQELISETKPDVILETGTLHGGSSALWATYLTAQNPEGRVITIDIEDQRLPEALALPITQTHVDFLLGSSTDPEVVREVKRRVEGKRVLVLLDSLHTADHVYGELQAYAELVPVGGYVVVQDTLVGVTPGIERFLAEKNGAFEIDRGRERFIISNSLGGYLRRVR